MTYLIEPRSNKRRTGGYIYNDHVCAGGESPIRRVAIPFGDANGDKLGQFGNEDVVIIDSLFLFHKRSVLGNLRRILPGTTIGMIHYLPSDDPFLTPLQRRYLRSREIAVIESLSGCIVPSDYIARVIRRDSRKSLAIEVVRPGVDNMFSNYRYRRSWPVRRIVTVSAISPAKGITIGLSALRRLRSYSFHWTIVGGATCDDRYRRTVDDRIRRYRMSNRVTLTGGLDADGVFRELYNADLYLSPSLQEGYGIAGAEAIAAGVPVAGFLVGGFGEAVTHGVNGILTRTTEPIALTRILEMLFRSHPRFDAVSRGAFSSSPTTRTWDCVARHFTDAVERIRGAQERSNLLQHKSVP